MPEARQPSGRGPAPHGVRNPDGLSASRGVLIPPGDQPPGGLDDTTWLQNTVYGKYAAVAARIQSVISLPVGMMVNINERL